MKENIPAKQYSFIAISCRANKPRGKCSPVFVTYTARKGEADKKTHNDQHFSKEARFAGKQASILVEAVVFHFYSVFYKVTALGIICSQDWGHKLS
ncbi:hypothetical protein DPMN_020589 [Dreissena polymorpha]|uniref:Uncharacterized protein n=1 Tax=Dreissena polymorpha TaxID=45954 RepID=A0A9D4NMU3_DREPO|nr:hypothetical protein DPMN_020589 [Dreissena polymorpha]